MLGSHCRSDQPHRPDRPNSKLDQLLYTTFSRPLLDPHTTLTTPPRLQPDSHPDLYSTNSTSTRSRPDRIDLVVQESWAIGRIEGELIGYWSVKSFYPDQTRSLHDPKNGFPDQLDLGSPNTRSFPDGFSSAWLLDLYSNFLDMSKIFG